MVNEFIKNEKYLVKIIAIESEDARSNFGIRVDGILGIKVFHKSENKNYGGVWDALLRERQGALVDLYEFMKKKFADGSVDTLEQHYFLRDGKVVTLNAEMKNTRKPFVRFSYAIGGDGRFTKDGTPKNDYASIISPNLDTQNRDTARPGGFVLVDTEEERQRMLWRCLDKECWLMRACSMCVKYGRNLIPSFIPYIDPKDERSDDEVARSWGMMML